MQLATLSCSYSGPLLLASDNTINRQVPHSVTNSVSLTVLNIERQAMADQRGRDVDPSSRFSRTGAGGREHYTSDVTYRAAYFTPAFPLADLNAPHDWRVCRLISRGLMNGTLYPTANSKQHNPSPDHGNADHPYRARFIQQLPLGDLTNSIQRTLRWPSCISAHRKDKTAIPIFRKSRTSERWLFLDLSL